MQHTVLDVLKAKHPKLKDPGLQPGIVPKPGEAFEPCPKAPTPIPLDITASLVETVAANLHGAGGPGSTDAVDLKNWLLRHGDESRGLREEVAAWMR